MKAVITVIGQDRTGIIAKVSGVLYAHEANILDITQTVLRDGIFTMIMLVDLDKCTVPFPAFKEALAACAEELGMEIQVQREEIFHSMHRI